MVGATGFEPATPSPPDLTGTITAHNETERLTLEYVCNSLNFRNMLRYVVVEG